MYQRSAHAGVSGSALRTSRAHRSCRSGRIACRRQRPVLRVAVAGKIDAATGQHVHRLQQIIAGMTSMLNLSFITEAGTVAMPRLR